MKQLILLLVMASLLNTAFSQKNPPKTYVITQAGISKYNDGEKTRPDYSFSAGMKIKNTFGLGLNAQYSRTKLWHQSYVPVSLEFSYLPESKKITPYVNIQAGKLFYDTKFRVYVNGQEFGRYRTTGSLYLSPNAGVLVPLAGRLKFLLSAGYTRVWLRDRSNYDLFAVYGVKPPASRSIINEGFKILAGLKF